MPAKKPVKPAKTAKPKEPLEAPPAEITVEEHRLKNSTRRDFLIFGVSAVAVGAKLWSVLPSDTQVRLGDKSAVDTPAKEADLNKILKFDDDVAEALYSPTRSVPTYDKSKALTPETLKNNYNGPTPDPGYLDDWTLTLSGLESGRDVILTAAELYALTAKMGFHEQVTRLVCVEGWSAIASWGGLRFADLLAAYPPMPDAKWAKLESSVNLNYDDNNNPVSDPYYVSIDLPTAMHPQTLLATHQSGGKLNVDHGAPVRLLAPMKLGLKNIKAITKITYSVAQPADYWNERGYSKYDGI
jgi:DMSO/TMAO reductase YedYZ molybdopterin-dependent catalytic subunit